VNYAGEIKLLADHKAGELLKQLQRKPGERTDRPRLSVGRGSQYAQTLEETETARATAKRWQRLAEIPEAMIAKYVAETKATDGAEISSVSRPDASPAERGFRKSYPAGRYQCVRVSCSSLTLRQTSCCDD
jgi:hypothetical protein